MKQKKGMFNRFLDGVEVVGNKLPHPMTIFVMLSLIVVVVSAICAKAGVSVDYTGINRKTFEIGAIHLKAKSLLSPEGIRYAFNSMTKNFTSFAPLGTVLVAIIGVGVADGSGLIHACLRKLVLSTSPKLLTAVLVFAGIMSNIASDAGYVVLVPLGAVIFMSVGRHPLAGIAAAFAGVSGGFSANLLIGTLDPLLGGISTEAARIFIPDYVVLPTANWYFMVVSTFLITFIGTYITEKIVEPRLGEYKGAHKEELGEVGDLEKKGLKHAGISLAIYLIIVLALTVPQNAIFRENGSIVNFMRNGLLPGIMFFFMIPGYFYGRAVGTIKSDKDLVKLIGKALSGMGGYMALVFAAAQFIKYFSYTNLGTIVAVKGADVLEAIGFTGFPLIVGFVIVSAFLNLFMGSASAKWAIMAPVFIPMFMKLGFTPEFTQAMYRIGDSSTNIISPLMSYFAFIVAYAQKYDEDSGIGTLISTMLPYSLCFLFAWLALLMIWYFAGLPIGPGVSTTMQMVL
ncbi:MAG: AbgT family transporter [Fusobacterium sp. JB021]|nr:AbgT family transporter [Fusobacterium sp. JB020]MDP0493835.1 AbgT family transporter [Fusobacterium sp. JB021]